MRDARKSAVTLVAGDPLSAVALLVFVGFPLLLAGCMRRGSLLWISQWQPEPTKNVAMRGLPV